MGERVVTFEDSRTIPSGLDTVEATNTFKCKTRLVPTDMHLWAGGAGRRGKVSKCCGLQAGHWWVESKWARRHDGCVKQTQKPILRRHMLSPCKRQAERLRTSFPKLCILHCDGRPARALHSKQHLPGPRAAPGTRRPCGVPGQVLHREGPRASLVTCATLVGLWRVADVQPASGADSRSRGLCSAGFPHLCEEVGIGFSRP